MGGSVMKCLSSYFHLEVRLEVLLNRPRFSDPRIKGLAVNELDA